MSEKSATQAHNTYREKAMPLLLQVLSEEEVNYLEDWYDQNPEAMRKILNASEEVRMAFVKYFDIVNREFRTF